MKAIICFLFIFPQLSWARLTIKSTLPEINWLVSEIVGDKGETSALLSGHEDPHFVDVTPAFIFKIKKIDLLVKNGLALESTWLPKIIELSGNTNFQKNGLCDASVKLDTEGKLDRNQVDRSMGDVHPEGNPHYTYSPKQMIRAGLAIKDCLQKIDKGNFQYYEKNFKRLEQKLTKLFDELNQRLSAHKSLKIMTYHEEFVYFCKDFGLNCLGTVEDTPGVLPSASQIFKKFKFAKAQRIDMVLATDANSVKILKKFKEISSIDFFQIEAHMNTKIKNYNVFVEQIVDAIEKHARK